MIWRSIVGKLWGTILIIVSIILFLLTIMLSQFFERHYISTNEQQLTEDVKRIADILQAYGNDDISRSISWQLVDSFTRVVVVDEKGNEYYSPDKSSLNEIVSDFFLNDSILKKAYYNGKVVHKKMNIPGVKKHHELSDDYLIVGVPLDGEHVENGAIYAYQSLIVIKNTMNQTMKYIILSAGIAIILTTFLAFFLSTRITAPLRKMKQAANEVSRGKFNTVVPISQTDEMGELAIAFNNMAKELKFNINALRQEKEQLSNILGSMVDGVMTFTREGEVLVLNNPAERFVQAWFYEKGLHSIEGQELPQEIYDLFSQVVTTEEEQITELNFQGNYWVIVMSPLYTDSNLIRGAVAIVRDMTAERKTDKLRKDFIANVSHELRTPIAMLQGYSEAIVDGFATSDEEIKELSQIIHDESLRMGRLVNDLLDLAKMESGNVHLQIEEANVQNFIERTVGKFIGLAKEKNITLHICFDSETTTFPFDVDKLEQVVTNLISNALRHTDNGGSIKVYITQTKESLTISVQDNGSGIPEDDLPFVFERFYKADKARTRGKSGTGLGLAIVKNIVQAHSGNINVYSKLGEGTEFRTVLYRKRLETKLNNEY